MASFGEVLARFKGSEEAENLVPLIEDDGLRKALVAWKSVSVRYKPSADCSQESPVDQWNWLWQQVEYDEKQFMTVAGIRPQDTVALLARLIGLRLIYPDGTINALARQYLQSIIMAKLQAAQRRTPGRPPRTPTPEESPPAQP